MVILGIVFFGVAEDKQEEVIRIQAHMAEQDARRTKALYKNLHYFKDPRTGLCFTGWIRGTATSLARVPCNALDRFEESK